MGLGMSADSVSAALINLNESQCVALVRQEADAGRNPLQILEELRRGMEEVGNRFEKSQYFLTELVMAAEIFKECMAYVEPKLKGRSVPTVGVVLMGTVQGDIHDLGKNIVAAVLTGAGFEVHDLGVDVPPEKFVEKAKELNPAIIGLSALITVSVRSMKTTIAQLRAAGIRSKIVIGGGIVSRDERVKDFVGADAVAKDAVEGLHLAQGFVGKG
jgi:5-methyltetrahydrofolate--homocysteine methyltransferase